MWFDFKEFALQLKALFRLCFLKPNSWREIVIAIASVLLAPIVILVCLFANSKFSSEN